MPLTAVDLDNALATLTPQMASQLRRFIPVDLADQIRASQRHAVTTMEIATGEQIQYRSTSTVAEWFRLGALDTLIRWINGTAKTCTHAPSPYRPEPVWSCAWKPGLVVCSYCTPMLKAIGEADKICDGCGHLCEGVEHDDPIRTTTAWVGGLAYQAGTCHGCDIEGDDA